MSWGAVYPGQGSQHPGMGKFLFDNFKYVQELFEEASDSVGVDFKKLCFEGPEEDLALTENTQPSLLLVSTASFQTIQKEYDWNPVAAAGHSIGEYAALVNAGVISFSDGIQAVKLRGQLMQSSVPVGEGAMLAVMGLSPEQVAQLCQWTTEKSGITPLEPANFNAPGQIVISGNAKAISWLQENFDKTIFNPEPRKVRLIPLKVSAPFHCSMMNKAEEGMRNHLESIDFSDAKHPIVQNFNAQQVTTGADLRENIIRQVSAPVRWVECVEELKNTQVTQCIELGCGKVLSGLIKKIDSENLKTFNLNSMEDFKAIESELK